MLSSKANAALTRVREIEEKYKMKRREQRWNRIEDTDSSISSVSLDLSENLPTQLKEPLRNSPKPKLDIKMPDMRFEGHDEGMKLLSQDKRSNRMNHAVDEGGLDVAMPSEDKSSSRSVGKQESFASDIITIQENSPIESVLDDSLVSSKSLSRSKTSRQLPSTANEEFPRHEGKTKAGPKSEKGKQSEKLFEMSRKKSSSVNSSIVKRSKISEKPNETVSKPRSNLRSREHSFEEKNIPKTELKKASSDRSSRNSKHSRSSRGDSVIDESINTLEDGSEIVSELSHIEKSVNERTADGSVNVSKPGRSIAEDASAVISSRLKHPAGENGYAYDTFEDISSSTMRSKSGSQSGRTIDGKKNTINLTDNRNTSDVKISSDKGSSNYTRNVENIDAKTHKRTSRRKSSLEMTSASQQESNREEREKVSNETRERLMMDVLALTVADDEERTQRSKSGSSRETSKPMKSGSSREKIESTKSGSSKEKSKSTKSGSSREKVESTKSDSSRKESEPTKSTSSREKSESTKSDSSREKIKSTKSGSSREKSEPTKSTSSRKKNEESEEDEDILVENSDRRIPSNVTNVLRKLHRDSIGAMVKRHASLNTVEHVYESSSGRKTEPEALEATSRRIARKKEKSSSHHRSSERDKTTEDNDREHSTKRKKRKARVTYSERAGAHDCAGSHKEYKTSRHDRKQIRELQKRVVELRLQQEREDLQKYIHELKDLRLGGSTSTPNYFSPLEFPKIAEFTLPDSVDFESKPDDQLALLRERVSAIRRWLKDQYILYRDYCTVAQAINARYVPTTLEDTKKTIRELRETAIKNR